MNAKRVVAVGIALFALIVAAGVIGLGLAYAHFQSAFGEPQREVALTVPPGSGASQIGARLEEHGVVRSGWWFSRRLRMSGRHRDLKAGEYRFELPLTPDQVIDILVTGRVETLPVTIPEGTTIYDTARLFAEAGFSDEATLLEAFKNPEPILDLDPEAFDLEGYLFPDTYRFARGTGAPAIAQKMVDTFRLKYRESVAPRHDTDEFGLRELVALASLVEKETGQAFERPLIAGVYRERLNRGMLLQCDPTIIYARILEGNWDGNIRRRDLTWDHPYNTYVRPGIPPGPIASPGLDSMLAVLEPEWSGALYFVSKGDGTHYFSKTLREHNRAVRKYQLGG